jgi:hypothetical protein
MIEELSCKKLCVACFGSGAKFAAREVEWKAIWSHLTGDSSAPRAGGNQAFCYGLVVNVFALLLYSFVSP